MAENSKNKEGIVIHIYRGPSSEKCRCRCGLEEGNPCEHVWDGPEEDLGEYGGSSVTCSRCGMSAFSHDMRV